MRTSSMRNSNMCNSNSINSHNSIQTPKRSSIINISNFNSITISSCSNNTPNNPT